MVMVALLGTVLLWFVGRPSSTALPPPTQLLVPESVTVHVAGLVHAPGLYRLPAGARVADAITAAGGPVEGAVLEAINLARVLFDGEQLIVAGPSGESGSAAAVGDARVNLNRAAVQQLQELPGVGPVLAQRIVDHRETRGPFRTVRDLRQVKGIGDKLFRALQDLVTV